MLTVDFLLKLFAQGWTQTQVLSEYPELTERKLKALFEYAAARIADEDTYPLSDGTG